MEPGAPFLQQLEMLKNLDVKFMDPNGPDFVHTIVETTKLAFADREKFTVIQNLLMRLWIFFYRKNTGGNVN